MSRWALCIAFMMPSAGCTRLNGAFVEEDESSGGQRPSTGPDATATATSASAGEDTSGAPTRGSTSAPTSTTTPPPPTGDSTGIPGTAGTSTDADRCLALYGEDGECDLYSGDSCLDGSCRPYGTFEELTGIACVEQLSEVESLPLGAPCSHACGGLLGADGCPASALCDPFTDDKSCLEFCEFELPEACPEGSSCFSYAAGDDNFGLCRTGCNPAGIFSGCAAGQTCLADDMGQFSCFPAPTNGGLGAPCAFVNDCAAGLACAPGDHCDNDGSCCSPFCSVALDDCPDGLPCVDIGLGVGICSLPE